MTCSCVSNALESESGPTLPSRSLSYPEAVVVYQFCLLPIKTGHPRHNIRLAPPFMGPEVRGDIVLVVEVRGRSRFSWSSAAFSGILMQQSEISRCCSLTTGSEAGRPLATEEAGSIL